MRKFNIFGESKKQRTIEDVIKDEIERRYKISKPTETYRPTFPFFNFEFEKKPNISDILKNIFNERPNRIELERLLFDIAPKEENSFDSALIKLHALAERVRSEKKDNYDFKIGDVPVKVYQKFIQVGYHVIPRYEYDNYINTLPNERMKENFKNLIVNITNNITINNIAA